MKDFRDETTYWRGRVGGPLREITFEAIVPSAWRGVPTKARRALTISSCPRTSSLGL